MKSFLKRAGTDREKNVELVVEWANWLDELAVIRANTREQARQSPLFEAPRSAADFLAVMQQARPKSILR